MRRFPPLFKLSYLSRRFSRYIEHKRSLKKAIAAAELFIFSFVIGNLAAYAVTSLTRHNPESAGVQAALEGDAILPASQEGNWGLSFQQEGKPPVANASMDYLKQYHAYYARDTEDKVLYLTFDAGYENGNTAAILDALKKHNAPATFFLVGNYLETSPEL